MFNKEEYYEIVHSGHKIDESITNDMLDYVKAYPHVILWGASFLGASLGKYLIEKGVKIECYWDLRASELGEVNGIKVVSPFQGDDKEHTIIIYCIGNNVIRNGLLKNLNENGFMHVLRGDFLYEGTVCPFDISTGIESSECQGSMCCRAMFCQRLENIVKSKSKAENPLSIYHVTLTINQRCSLRCKCCTSYMNEYPLNQRIDFPLARIEQDIDSFFDAVDSVGSVTVMGGEPFMHPGLSRVVNKLLTKSNVGLVCIATTGTYPIKDCQLEGLEDPRVNVSFSNYEQSITENQRRMMYQSIEKVKEKGIAYTVGVVMPEWTIPSTLYDLRNTPEEMERKKRNCTHPPRCMMIKDGKLHPCDFAAAVYHLGIADYQGDYLELDSSISSEILKEEIRKFIEKPYYRVCGHCTGPQGITSKAAEQGYMDFKNPIQI